MTTTPLGPPEHRTVDVPTKPGADRIGPARVPREHPVLPPGPRGPHPVTAGPVARRDDARTSPAASAGLARDAEPIAAPVFVDATGRRRRRARRVAWVLAAFCMLYITVFGAGVVGRPVEPTAPDGAFTPRPPATASPGPTAPAVPLVPAPTRTRAPLTLLPRSTTTRAPAPPPASRPAPVVPPPPATLPPTPTATIAPSPTGPIQTAAPTEPVTTVPDTSTPETTVPETNPPDTTEPETNPPDTTSPDTDTPEATGEETAPGAPEPPATGAAVGDA